MVLFLAFSSDQPLDNQGVDACTSFSIYGDVYKDMVSGKDYPARKTSMARKSHYIKGFQPSRC
jgi:hypothetical protein